MKQVRCFLIGHSWTKWDLVHVLYIRIIGRVTGLYTRHCPHCGNSQWRTIRSEKSAKKS